MLKRVSIVSILVLVSLLLWPEGYGFSRPPVALAAGGEGVRVDVRVGFGNRFLATRFLPVTVSLENRGPDLRAVLTISVPQGSKLRGNLRRISHSFNVLLPQGSLGRYRIVTRLGDTSEPLKVELLLPSGELLLSRYIDARPFVSSRELMTILMPAGGQPERRQPWRHLPANLATEPTYAHPFELPDTPAGLEAVRCVTGPLEAFIELEPSQVEALTHWAHMGGQVLAVLGQDSPFAGKDPQSAWELLPDYVRTLVPKPPGGDSALYPSVTRRMGRGTTTLMLLDPNDPDGEARRVAHTLISLGPQPGFCPIYLGSFERAIYSVLESLTYQPPTRKGAAWFLVAYVAVVGMVLLSPQLYGSGYGRYFAVMGGVILASSLISGFSVAQRIHRDRVFLTQVDSLEGSSQSRYLRLASYIRIQAPSVTPSANIELRDYGKPGFSWVLPSLGGGDHLEFEVSYSNDRGPTRVRVVDPERSFFRVDSDQDLPIHVAFGEGGRGDTLELRNLSPYPLKGCVLAMDEKAVYIGDLLPGARCEASLKDMSSGLYDVIGKSSGYRPGGGEADAAMRLKETLLTRVVRLGSPTAVTPEGEAVKPGLVLVGWVEGLRSRLLVDGRKARELRVSCLVLRISFPEGIGGWED